MAQRLRVLPLVAGLLLVSVLGSCDSGSSPPKAKPAHDLDLASIGADLKSRGPYSSSGRATSDTRHGRVTGAFDAAAKLGRVRFPVFVEKRSGIAELRMVAEKDFLRRAPISGAAVGGLNAALVDATGAGTWLELSSGAVGIAGLLVGPYVPQYLIEHLAAAPPSWTSVGTKRIGGTTARGWNAKPLSGGGMALKTVTVWLGGSTLARVEFETLTGVAVAYDLAGADRAVAVQAPAPNQVVSAPAAAAPSGAFVEVASGNDAAVGYRVFRAPSSTGGSCWRVESTPAYDTVVGSGDDQHVCVPSVAADDDPTDQVQFVADASDQSVFEMIGMLLPAGATGVLTLADGTMRLLAPDLSGFAVSVGPAAPIAGYLEVALADGSKLACGPGAVTSPSEVIGAGTGDGPDPTALRRQPWACLTFESLGR